MRCPVLSQRRPCTALGARYAVSDTELAYGAARRLTGAARRWCQCPAIRCPVSRPRSAALIGNMVLSVLIRGLVQVLIGRVELRVLIGRRSCKY
eukprot:2292930-Rhodomonas_salina.4